MAPPHLSASPPSLHKHYFRNIYLLIKKFVCNLNGNSLPLSLSLSLILSVRRNAVGGKARLITINLILFASLPPAALPTFVRHGNSSPIPNLPNYQQSFETAAVAAVAFIRWDSWRCCYRPYSCCCCSFTVEKGFLAGIWVGLAQFIVVWPNTSQWFTFIWSL